MVVDLQLSKFSGEDMVHVIRLTLICTYRFLHRRPSMSRVVSVLIGYANMLTETEEVIRPSNITEWQVIFFFTRGELIPT